MGGWGDGGEGDGGVGRWDMDWIWRLAMFVDFVRRCEELNGGVEPLER